MLGAGLIVSTSGVNAFVFVCQELQNENSFWLVFNLLSTKTHMWCAMQHIVSLLQALVNWKGCSSGRVIGVELQGVWTMAGLTHALMSGCCIPAVKGKSERGPVASSDPDFWVDKYKWSIWPCLSLGSCLFKQYACVLFGIRSQTQTRESQSILGIIGSAYGEKRIVQFPPARSPICLGTGQ